MPTWVLTFEIWKGIKRRRRWSTCRSWSTNQTINKSDRRNNKLTSPHDSSRKLKKTLFKQLIKVSRLVRTQLFIKAEAVSDNKKKSIQMNLLDRNLLIKRCFIRQTLSRLWANFTYKTLLTWTQNKSNRNLGHWIKITKSAALIHFQKWEFFTSIFD